MKVPPLACRAPEPMIERGQLGVDNEVQAAGVNFRDLLGDTHTPNGNDAAQQDADASPQWVNAPVQTLGATITQTSGAPSAVGAAPAPAPVSNDAPAHADARTKADDVNATRFEDLHLFRGLQTGPSSGLEPRRRGHDPIATGRAPLAPPARAMISTPQDLQAQNGSGHTSAPRPASPMHEAPDPPRINRSASITPSQASSIEPRHQGASARTEAIAPRPPLNKSTSATTPVFVAFHAADGVFSVLARAGRMAPTERTKLRHALGALLAEYNIFDASLSIDGEGDARWPK